jgi:hypothetical protein
MSGSLTVANSSIFDNTSTKPSSGIAAILNPATLLLANVTISHTYQITLR